MSPCCWSSEPARRSKIRHESHLKPRGKHGIQARRHELVHQGRGRHPRRRHRRAGAPDARPGAHRRAPRAEDRHVRLGLPWLAGRHAGCGAPQATEAAARKQHQFRRRHQRRPRRHRGVGHADAALGGQEEVRRRHRHVVRQGARRGPQRRCVEACQLHRHRQERRRRRGGRRRPELQVLVAVQPVRADAVPRRHALAVSGQRAGDPRPRAARVSDVAPFGAVDRAQDRHQHRRRHGHRRGLARAAQVRHARPDVRRQGLHAEHEPGHERARAGAGDGAVALHAPARGRQALCAREQAQQRRVPEPRRVARHHHRGQDLQRSAPVLPRTGPGRRLAAPIRRAHPEDGHAVPDGADDRARIRAGPGRNLRHRGEASVPRDVRQERSVRQGQRAAHRRQVRRGRKGAAAVLR